MPFNTTVYSSFSSCLISHIHQRLRDHLGDFNEQFVALRFNGIWKTLSTGEDCRASTSREPNVDEEASDPMNLKMNIIILSVLIQDENSSMYNGLE